MLVLSRRVGERILIDGNISITVLRSTGVGVRVGIDAPSNVKIIREELESGNADQGGVTEQVPESDHKSGCNSVGSSNQHVGQPVRRLGGPARGMETDGAA